MPETPTINALLHRLTRLTDLSGADLARVQALCATTRTVEARQDIFRSGERLGHLHVLLKGWACRYRALADGRRQYPALFVPGDTGDLDRLMLDHLTFGLSTLTRCTVALIPLDRLRVLFDESPAVRDVFWWLTCVENAVSSEWGVSLGRRSALERLAHLICELLVRLKTVGAADDRGFPLPLTQEDLADASGLSIVHVNRTLQLLRNRSLIRLEERRLTILDWEGLKRLADFNPDYLHLERPRAEVGAPG